MPVSPIGNMNFVNQNMAYPATQASNELAKEGFAATLNMAEFNEKEKTLNKLEKVNETHEIKEEIKEKAEQEEKRKNTIKKLKPAMMRKMKKMSLKIQILKTHKAFIA